ncbi:MAG: cellulase family glycosylhydrolase [Myxococcales bacterium]|nr:cellulase family glycosylhydrolase [Myxococcales bacterium]
MAVHDATTRARDASAVSDAARARGFVTRRGVCLVRDGARLRLVGSSAFHLQEERARQALGWTGSLHTVQRTFERAQANGVRVLRVTAFNERADDVATIQSALGVLREPGLVALDRVIAEATERDVLLIVVLSNYWGDYGGFPRYLEWLGLPSDYEHRALAMRDARFRQALAGYFSAIVRRRNTVTGRAYGEEPAILAWELVNEPRGTNLDDGGVTFASFLHELAVTVKQAGARQLVVAGDEGYDSDTRGYDVRYWNRLDDRLLNRARGESFRRVVSDPAIDAATVHWYPDHWRVPTTMAREGGARWLREHVAIAEQNDKPVLFEEFGLMAPRHPSLEARREAYDHWFATALSLDAVAAAMPWGLHWNPDFHERDGFEWGARDGDDDPYSAIVRRYSARFAESASLAGCTREERAANAAR